MVFSMNVFKNKKLWQNKKTLKTFKKRALNKKRKKNVLCIYDYYCYCLFCLTGRFLSA